MCRFRLSTSCVIALLVLAAGCGAKKAPVPIPQTAPPSQVQAPSTTPVRTSPTAPEPPQPVVEPPIVPMEPIAADDINTKDLDSINRAQPLKPAFFVYDSDQLDSAAQQALTGDAQTLKTHANWMITIEGHCDERGTAEYNLALGERRALAAKNYLVSLGIDASRFKTVSYGKEFPFDPAKSDDAFALNRRAHFVVTAK